MVCTSIIHSLKKKKKKGKCVCISVYVVCVCVPLGLEVRLNQGRWGGDGDEVTEKLNS